MARPGQGAGGADLDRGLRGTTAAGQEEPVGFVDLETVVRRLAAEVGELQLRVTEVEGRLGRQAGLSSNSAAAAPTTHVHVNLATPCGAAGPLGPPPEEGRQQAAAEPDTFTAVGGTFRRPTPGDPRSGPDAKVKHYSVTVGNSTPAGQPGTYADYARYADAVRNPDTPWTGRGKLDFATGVNSLSFPSRREAEEWYRAQLGLPSSAPVPHWP